MFSNPNPPANKQPVDIQHVRRQARLRLIGALILVLILVSVFSFLLQSSPQTPAADIPFVNIAANKSAPLVPETLPPEPTFTPQDPNAAATSSIRVPSIESLPQVKTTQPTQSEVAQPKAKDKTKTKKTKTDISKQWVVQLGAFRNKNSVARALKKAKTNGVDAFTNSVNTSGGVLTRVQVGPFVNKAEAEKAARQLKRLGFKEPSVKKSSQ